MQPVTASLTASLQAAQAMPAMHAHQHCSKCQIPQPASGLVQRTLQSFYQAHVWFTACGCRCGTCSCIDVYISGRVLDVHTQACSVSNAVCVHLPARLRCCVGLQLPCWEAGPAAPTWLVSQESALGRRCVSCAAGRHRP